MAKVNKETFGEAGVDEMISPFTYQFTGKGTPEYPCQLEGDDSPVPTDPVGFIPKCSSEKSEKGKK